MSDVSAPETPKVELKSKKRKLDDDEAARKAERKERKRQKKLEKEKLKSAEAEPSQQDSEEPPKKKKKKSKSKSREETVDESTTPTLVASRSGTNTPKPTSQSDEDFLQAHSITIHDGDMSPFQTFDDIPIPKIRTVLQSRFEKPTPIQACAWPALLEGKDVVGIAETGSGKTLSFALPAIARLIDSPSKASGPTVLVLAPTRELAVQSHENFQEFAAPFGFESVCVYGGAPKGPQIATLKKKNLKIVVATPGRLLDLLNDGATSLERVNYLVLDEADRMLDQGFENDIRKIIGECVQGSERQTVMFSATWPESVRRLASTFLKSPIRITVGSEDLSANKRVEQVVEVMEERQKDKKLMTLLQQNKGMTRILVFCLYKKEAARVEETLKNRGYQVAAIHGDLRQAAREQALADFKTGKAGVMVATDVAARGLDIPDVNMVINYTFPLTVEDYVHRIGRTGRAGKSGKSYTFFTGDNQERGLAGELMRVLREANVTCEALKRFPMTVKKKEHSAYGAFYKEIGDGPTTGTKIKFK